MWDPHKFPAKIFVCRAPPPHAPRHDIVDAVLAIVAPGQGAQTPGFLAPWLTLPRFADRLGWFAAVTGLDLAHFGTEADADTIRDTAVAQPLLVAAALATAAELLDGGRVPANTLVAGHSVGEIAAAALAGTISSESALVLVRERGRAMAEASAARPTSMTAVIGGDRDEVLAAIASCGLTPANNNGPGQIVAAGLVDQLERLADNPPARARLIPLSVAGAFHTEHMRPAVDHLRRLAGSVPTSSASAVLLSNRDGAVVTDGADYLARVVDQVANPVRWDLCMTTLVARGVSGHARIGPCRYAHRHRPPPDEGCRDLQPQHPRPARRRPRVRRAAFRPRSPSPLNEDPVTTLNTRPGHRYARLMSVGGYRGSRVVDNAEMCTIIDSSDEWIRQRTGIVERRWATDDETPLSMSVAAARKAIERAGLIARPDRRDRRLDRQPLQADAVTGL